MKSTNKMAAILLLMLATIACSTSAIRTVEVTRVVLQTVVVTEPIQASGFTTGTPVNVSTLPILMEVGGGGAPMPCFTENSEPSVSWGFGIFPNEALCLNNFPTTPDGPSFTVTMTDPLGRTFGENFTYSQNGILNSKGANAGYIEDGSGVDGMPGTPAVNLRLYLPASFPCGNWQVSASTQDGRINVPPTALAMDCQYQRLSALSDLNTNPFVPPAYGLEGPVFVDRETIYIIGTAYPPNTALTVALYQDDPSLGKSEIGQGQGAARYAVSVMSDASGNFQAPFVVGSVTPRGAYYVVTAPVITPDLRLDVFGARFSIK